MYYAIYAGHGGTDPGAVSGSRKEKDYTLEVANALTALLKADGHSVLQNRTSDVSRSITADANKANSAGVKCVVELHLNSNSGTPGTGTETLYYPTSSASKTLATNIQTRVIAATGYTDRGIKSRDNLGILKQTNMPAALIEMAFINNDSDMTKFDINVMANAIRQGICDTYGGTASESTATTPTEASSGSGTSSGTTTTDLKAEGIKKFQAWLNSDYAMGLTVDGIYGANTRTAAIKCMQMQFGVTVDGVWGTKSKAACVTLGKGDSGHCVYILQGMLYCRGSIYSGFDGTYGSLTESEVKAWQKANGLTQDGIAGKDTFTSLFAA